MSDEWFEIRRSSIHGQGVFATRVFHSGERLGQLEGTLVEQTTTNENCVGLAPQLWIDPEPPFLFLNHSCRPNACLGARKSLWSLTNISISDEITIDYSTTEADPLWSMSCACGAAECRLSLGPIQLCFSADNPPRTTPALMRFFTQHGKQSLG